MSYAGEGGRTCKCGHKQDDHAGDTTGPCLHYEVKTVYRRSEKPVVIQSHCLCKGYHDRSNGIEVEV